MKKFLATLVLATFVWQPSVYAEENSAKMQEHMERMSALMAEIEAEQSPRTLARLMSEHMALMLEAMEMLDDSNTAASDLTIEVRVAAVEQKLGMLQMMMSQMMNHEEEERRRPLHEHKR